MNDIKTAISPVAKTIKQVVPFDPQTDHLLLFDLTAANQTLTPEMVGDTALFSNYINSRLKAAGATYGIGGYNEHRTVYARSGLFDGAGEPRRLHLGVDIWGAAGTPVHAPVDGTIHSFANNEGYGDYGATIILQHVIGNFVFYSLYGHLSAKDLLHLRIGQVINAGEKIAHFGKPEENGQWPPHLHFQLMLDMRGYSGDYPGVCKFSERSEWLANSPDPDLFLQMMQYAKPDQY